MHVPWYTARGHALIVRSCKATDVKIFRSNFTILVLHNTVKHLQT
jgi:hypothetical protein